MEKHRIFFTIFGTLFILTSAVAAAYSIATGLSASVIWYCYAALLVTGIGLLKRDGTLIGSQVMIMGIPFLVWNVDFFYTLITGTSLWGITSYFFSAGPLLPRITTLQHVITVPILLYALSIHKMHERSAWKLAILTVVIMFTLSFTLTDPAENVNCAFYSCVPFITLSLWYPLIWFTTIFVMMLATYYLLVRCKLTET